MSEAHRLRQVAAELHGTRAGMEHLLAEIAQRHRPVVWSSAAADRSRARLRGQRQPLLVQAERTLSACVNELLRRATEIELAEGGG